MTTYKYQDTAAGSTETGAAVKSDTQEDLESSTSEARKVATTCCSMPCCQRRLNPEQLQHLISKYGSYWQYYDIRG